MSATNTENKMPAAPLVPAGLMIGMGMGFAFGNLTAGMFLGMGCGFLLYFILTYFRHT